MTQEEKAKAYNKALKAANNELKCCGTFDCDAARLIFRLFPGLAEDENERIKKDVKRAITVALDYSYFDEETADNCLAWLEKQGEPAKLSEEEQNRFAKGVLTSCALSFIDYLDAHKYEGKMCVSNGECEDIENAFHNAMWDRLHRYYCKYIEKQGEQILANSAQTCKDEQKPTDKVEPRFKVKYAGSEYNVFEVKDIAGVTFYGIEDETNHIDYVRAENCERVDGYSIKENGSPYSTKPAVFSEQNPAWRETLESLRHKWSKGNSAEAKYKVEAYDELIEMLKEVNNEEQERH